MEVILDLYQSLFPYLLFIPLGYWMGIKKKYTKVWLTNLLIYLLMPVLVINHILEADKVKLTVLPIISFLLAAAMVFPAKIAFHFFSKAENPYLLKSSFSFFNVAFFGIPIFTTLFGEESITALICIYLGSGLYGNTIGYYLVAKSKYSTRRAISKIFKIPFLYVFLFAFVLKFMKFEMPVGAGTVMHLFGLVVSAGGMMIIGMNLIKINFQALDRSYFFRILSLRTVSAVGIMGLLLLLEFFLLDQLGLEDRKMLALIPFFPVAANVTVYASFLQSKEEASALWVLFTLIISLVLVPLVAMWY